MVQRLPRGDDRYDGWKEEERPKHGDAFEPLIQQHRQPDTQRQTGRHEQRREVEGVPHRVPEHRVIEKQVAEILEAHPHRRVDHVVLAEAVVQDTGGIGQPGVGINRPLDDFGIANTGVGTPSMPIGVGRDSTHFDFETRMEKMQVARVDMAIITLPAPSVFWGSGEVSLELTRSQEHQI